MEENKKNKTEFQKYLEENRLKHKALQKEIKEIDDRSRINEVKVDKLFAIEKVTSAAI